jgi:5'-nucleotidase/UDP-sugar diphosphatase
VIEEGYMRFKGRIVFQLIMVLTAVSMVTSVIAEERILTIVHTNDLHSHLLGFSPNIDYTPYRTGDDKTIGGWARIATVIKELREERSNAVLTLDAGDFLMGSLFHMVSREEAFELRLLKEMGYDVVSLGNHEFDLMPGGLARILSTAHRNGKMPMMVLSNAHFSDESDRDDSLEAIFKKGIVKTYTVLEREGIRIGIYGLMGARAAEVAPFASPVKFDDTVKTSREMVRLLREKEKVDMVICLSHSGLLKDKSKSEDEILAREVDGIDIIVSGHTHTLLLEPIIVNNTIVVQAGAYGKQVGILDIVYENEAVRMKEYQIVRIDDRIKGNAKINNLIDSCIEKIDAAVLRDLGLTFYKIIAATDFDLTIEEDESSLGNMITDSMRWYANKYDYDETDPLTRVAVAIESFGLIRDPLLRGRRGDIAVCDLFRTFPLGIGMDDTMCYPIITFYLHASELKKALEILTSIYPLKGSDYYLQISGLQFRYNPHRMIFDRVTDIWMGDEESGYEPLDYSDSNKRLYRIAANFFNATFLKVIGGFTMNILNIVPKDREGNPVTDLKEVRVDMDKKKPGIQELKEWIGLMEYVKSFKDIDGDGIPDVPKKYKGKLGRIVKKASWNPVSLLWRGTWITWTAFAVFMVLLLIFAVVIRIIVRRVFTS